MSSWQDYVNGKYKKSGEKKQSYAEHVQEKYGKSEQAEKKSEAAKKTASTAKKYVGWGSKAQPESVKRTEAKAASREEEKDILRGFAGSGWGARLMLDRQRETADERAGKDQSEALRALQERLGATTPHQSTASSQEEALPAFKRQNLTGSDRFAQAEATGEYNPYEDALAAMKQRMAEQAAQKAKEQAAEEQSAIQKPGNLPQLTANNQLLGGNFSLEDFNPPQTPNPEIEKQLKEADEAAAQSAFDAGEWAEANAKAGWTQIGGRIMQGINAAFEPAQEAGADLFDFALRKIRGDEYADMLKETLEAEKAKPALGAVYDWAVDPMNKATDYAEAVNEEGGYLAKIGGSVIQNAVAQIPDAITALMSGGASTALDAFNRAQTTFGGAVLDSAKKMATSPNFLMSFGQMYGGRYEDAVEGGANAYTAALTATLTTLMNSMVEQGGGIENLPFTKATVGDWVKNALDEGKEEAVQQVIDQIGQKMYVDGSIPWYSTENENAVINPKVLGENALVGALAGAALGGPGMIVNNALNGNAQEQTEDFGGAPEMSDIALELAQEENRSGLETPKKEKEGPKYAAMNAEEIRSAQEKAGRTDRYGDIPQTVPIDRRVIDQLAQETADAEIAEEQAQAATPPQSAPQGSLGETDAQEAREETTAQSAPAPHQSTPSTAFPQGEAYVREAAKKIQDAQQKRQFMKAAQKYGKAGIAFAGNYEGGDVAAYDRGFNALYTAGRTNLTLQQLGDKIDALTEGMSDTQKRAIWQAGRNEDVNTVKPGVRQMITTRATANEHKSFRILDEIGKKYGYQFDIVDSIAGGIGNGAYSGGGRIVVAKDAADGAIVQAGVHELVHALKRSDADAYNVLQEVVVQHLESSEMWPGLDYAVNERKEQYRAAGQNLTRTDALEEIICEAVPTFLTDEKATRAFVNQNRTLAMRIRDFFVNFAKEIREIAMRYMENQGRDEIANLLGRSDALTEIALTLDAALEAAGEKEAAAAGETVFAKGKAKPLMDEEEFANFYSKIGEMKIGKEAQFHETKDGLHIFDIENKLVYTDGNWDHPGIVQVVTFTYRTKMRNDAAKKLYVECEDDGKRFGEIRSILKRNLGTPAVSIRLGMDGGSTGWYGRRGEGQSGGTTDRVDQGNENADQTHFSLNKPVEQVGELVAVHNVDPEGLARSLNLGGIPAPSIAVVKSSGGHLKFGTVSLVFHKDSIDPEADARNRVYGYDAWTPDKKNARVEYEVNEEAENRIRNIIYSMAEQMPESYKRKAFGFVDSLGNKLNSEGGAEGLIEKAAENRGLRAAYLASDARYQKLDDELNAIIDDVRRANPYADLDAAATAIMNAAQDGSRTAAAIVRSFKKNGLTIDKTVGERIAAMYKEASEFPTGYFEAKPERVVGFDEVKAAIVPDSMDKSIRDQLNTAVENVIVYPDGDETARLNALNGLEGVRFSMNNTAPIESVMTDDQNLMLPADVDVREESIRGVAASALSRGLNERMNQQITGVANKILKETGSTYAKADIIANMKGLIDEYAANGATEETLRAVAEMAKKVIESSRHADNTLREQYADLRRKLRETGISLTETQKQEAANEAGSYDAWRKSLTGTVKTVNDGISLDAIWGEISSQYPEIFPPETGEAEMVGKLTDFMMLMKPKYENPYGMDMDGAALEMAMRIQGDLMGILGAKDAAKAMYGTAEKFRGRYEAEFKAKLAQQKKERVEKFQQIAADLKAAKAAGNAKEQAAVMNRYRAAMKATALDEAYAEVRATYKAREEQKAENRKANELRGRVARQAGELMKMFTRPEKGKRIPTGLQGLVLDVLETLDINGERAAAAGKETQKAAAFREKLNGIRTFYEQVINSQSRGEAPEGLDGLMMAFSERNLGDVTLAIDTLLSSGEKFRLRDMNSRELHFLELLLNTVKHTVDSVGKLWRMKRYESVMELGDASIEEMDERGQQRIDADSAAGKARDFLALDMLEPVSYGERLGEGGQAVIQGLMDGEKEKFSRIREAAAATEQMMKDAGISGYDIGKWRKNVRTVKLGSGKVVRMSDVNIMELYLTAKRPQGLQHLLANGMKIQSREAGQQPKHITLTQADITQISGMLDAKQRKIADLMQGYLSGDVAKWGNDVTQRLYLYDAFTEPTYWPISSDPNSLKTQEPEGDRAFTAITNAGFTKPLNVKATNPIIIGDAFDTFNRHIGEMASYAGYAEAMTDTLAWINYRQRGEDGLMTGSVKESIETLLGKGGIKYLTKLVQDINGARRESGKTLIDKLGRNAKIAAVAGKLSVAIQQPTSIIRAAAEINPWYLLRGFKAGKNAAAEMMKYSSLAWWKSNGNYDIGIGKSADEIFWGKTTRGDAVMEKISTSGGLIDPGKVDDWAWTRMWSAVKREISATRKELKPGSDEYFKAVAERFEYICDRTQVVDTVMHRSDMMRSKNDVTKMLTSFQSEPTKSYNMMARAIMNAGRNSGDRAAYGKLARVTTAYAASVAANAAIKAVYEAFRYRDDEEDETLNYIFKGEFAQDWTERFLMNTVSGLNPLENTPIVSTVYEMIPGDRIARYLGAEKYSDYLPSGDLAGHMGLEGISDLISSGADILQYLLDDNSGKRTWYGVWGSFAKSASDAFGLPFSGILANIETLGRIYDPEWLQTKSNMATTSAAFDKLYEAMVSGDKKAALSIRTEFAKGMYGNTPKSPQEIDQGISDKLAINDERILEAWKLRNVDAQYGKLAALYKEIQKDGFTDDMIKRAVNNAQSRYQDEYERLIEDEKPDEAKALLEKCAGYGMQLETEKAPKDLTKELDVSTYEYKDLHRAVRESSISDMAAVYEIMLEESEAEDPEQAVRDSISEEFREEYVGLVKGGKTQEAEELAKRLDVFGFDEEDRLEWVKDDYRENLKKAVEGGEMKEAEKLIEVMKDEYEMTDESIASTIRSRFEQEYIDLVIAGKDKEADELAEKLQELGLKYADGNNRFKQANLNKWVLEWEREQEEE